MEVGLWIMDYGLWIVGGRWWMVVAIDDRLVHVVIVVALGWVAMVHMLMHPCVVRARCVCALHLSERHGGRLRTEDLIAQIAHQIAHLQALAVGMTYEQDHKGK